jgi:hypothetical protein
MKLYPLYILYSVYSLVLLKLYFLLVYACFSKCTYDGQG